MAVYLPLDLIISDPQIRGGRPVLAGTQVRVQDIAAAYLYRGQSPQEVAANYALEIAQVHAALAYYYQHEGAFEAQFAEDEATAARLRDELAAHGKLLKRG